VTFSLGALSRMLRTQRMGDPHLVLCPPAAWTDRDIDRAADSAMWAEFEQAGWLRRDGHLHDAAHDRLATLARPLVEYAAWFTEDGGRLCSAVAAGVGSQAVVAFRDADRVELRGLFHDESLSMALLRQVPDNTPAPIEALNISLRNGDLGGTRKLRALVNTGRRAEGELYVGIRDRDYAYRSNVDNPVRYDDYPAGRVLLVLSPSHLSVVPATKTLLRRRLEEARRELG
jgi:hypothetical protein